MLNAEIQVHKHSNRLKNLSLQDILVDCGMKVTQRKKKIVIILMEFVETLAVNQQPTEKRAYFLHLLMM